MVTAKTVVILGGGVGGVVAARALRKLLPRDREVVAYCRGRYCVLAISAVEALRARGYRAARLEDGVPDWRARGLPIAVSATEGNP